MRQSPGCGPRRSPLQPGAEGIPGTCSRRPRGRGGAPGGRPQADDASFAPDAQQGVHELRLRDRAGAYRVVYVIIAESVIHLVHAFKKTSQATPKRNLDVARARVREIKP
ncbi:MAG: type II toxin-antitoxin system RelE/ParE family toxin [Polyangiaceae bacterium]|nr:type II toxin-antitoxin system RelE/ParE family toxin [Polyangiaceae bacterium]